MKYQNAKEILDSELFMRIQAEAGGHLLYVPAAGGKKSWGELSGGKIQFAERNRQIYGEYLAGIGTKELAAKWFLSVDSIRKIVAAERSRRPAHYLGCDIGGTNIKFGAVDVSGEVVMCDSVPTPRTEEGLLCALQEIIKMVREKDPYIVGIGISCAGTIENGNRVYAVNLPLDGTPLRDTVARYSELPVKLENDGNCAALGEYLEMQEEENLVYISIGTGIGMGLILNGRLYKGWNGNAGEGGHMMLVYGGKDCSCGKKGCFECYASAAALTEQTERAVQSNPDSLLARLAKEHKMNGELVFKAAQKGCSVAEKVLDQYTDYLAAGIDNICELLDPKYVVLAGGIVNQGEAFLDMISSKVRKNVMLCLSKNTGFAAMVGSTRLFTGVKKR